MKTGLAIVPRFVLRLALALFLFMTLIACAPVFGRGKAAQRGQSNVEGKASANESKTNKLGEPIFAACEQSVTGGAGTSVARMKVTITGVPRSSSGAYASLGVPVSASTLKERSGKFDIASVRVEGDYPTDKGTSYALLGHEMPIRSIRNGSSWDHAPKGVDSSALKTGTVLRHNEVVIQGDGGGWIRLVYEAYAGALPSQRVILSDMRPSLQASGIGGFGAPASGEGGCTFWHNLVGMYGTD